MKTKIFFIIIASFFIFHSALADDSTSTPILNLEVSVDVPANCVATDTDEVAHIYQASSSASYLGICALEAALASSSLSSIELSNQYPSIGLFVTALDGVEADPDSQYWALYQNGDYASVGITLLPVSASDTIVFQLHDFSDNDLGDQVTLDINSLVATSSDDTATSTTDVSTTTDDTSSYDSSDASTSTPNTTQNTESDSGGGGGGIVHHTVNVGNAINFLEANENPDGSFSDSSMYTDWVAIAFAADGTVPPSLKNYELTSSPTLSSVTDYERHAMALEALNINPYSGISVNCIEPIVDSFDGNQIGDPSLVNDDIFSIFPLIKAGYSSSDNIIQKVVANILSKQASDGSWWDESVDLTAAATQALGLTPSLSGVSQALSAARSYLLNEEQSNGSFGSDDGTSWTLQAIVALGGLGTNWTDGGNNPYDYLYSLQQNDGGMEPASEDMNTRIWATAYAIPATLSMPWASILNSFSKPIVASSAANTTVSAAAVQNNEVSTSTRNIVATSSVASGAGLGSLVRSAPTTRSPSPAPSAPVLSPGPVSEATSTKFSSQAAAVVENENPATITTKSVVFGTASFVSVASLVYLLIIII